MKFKFAAQKSGEGWSSDKSDRGDRDDGNNERERFGVCSTRLLNAIVECSYLQLLQHR